MYSAREWYRRQTEGAGKQTQSPRDFQERMNPFYTAKPLFKGEMVGDYQVEIIGTEILKIRTQKSGLPNTYLWHTWPFHYPKWGYGLNQDAWKALVCLVQSNCLIKLSLLLSSSWSSSSSSFYHHLEKLGCKQKYLIFPKWFLLYITSILQIKIKSQRAQ